MRDPKETTQEDYLITLIVILIFTGIGWFIRNAQGGFC